MGMGFKSFLVAGVVLSVVMANASLAAAKPRVSFTLPTTASAGVATPFSYATKGLTSGSRVVLQRQQGTARAWRTVAALAKVKAGSSALPALPLGIYGVRIAAIAHHGKIVAEQRRSVKVFGEVPFTTLFSLSSESHAAVLDGANQPGVYTTPSRTFNYAFASYANQESASTILTVGNNTCRSVHIDFVPGVQGSESSPGYQNASATLSVVQQSLDPTTSTAGFNAFGALDAVLVPGQSWSVTTLASKRSIDLYINGSAICYQGTPLTRP
jgi:hypothetical protein